MQDISYDGHEDVQSQRIYTRFADSEAILTASEGFVSTFSMNSRASMLREIIRRFSGGVAGFPLRCAVIDKDAATNVNRGKSNPASTSEKGKLYQITY